ncbi:aminopeptidase PepB [Psychrosphaera aestuarii]|uniref:aminopeptidase PepB n=1 Tax=Psychrosphaera aestuarii TaxID=1266052 RepID=UPI001B3352C9|nr:aminopeptidase PepB [Psychrosphaera aestuarii]
MTKLLSIKLSTTPAPQAWGEDNQLSVAPEGFTIHIGDLSLQDSLSVIQSTARKIQGMGVNQLAIEGDWDIEQQWSLYQGLVTAKGGQSVAWLAQDVKELDARKKTFDWTREMTNMPPAEMYPLELANQAVKFIKELAGDAVSHSLVIGDDLQEAGWMGIHSVGRASIHPPVLLSLDYNPTGDESAPIEYALVGKGITFDSGGYSIKSSEGMLTMKCDMGGAATVTGALGLAILRGLNKRVRLILCCAENMIAGNAYRLGDVITYKNGLTVEVVNTDAEGRLVLADGLLHANELGAKNIIDAATLTGAAMMAVGGDYNAMFALDDSMANRGLAAAAEEFEGAWRLPLAKFHRNNCPSAYADTANSRPQKGGGMGGASNAAGFLSRFVNEEGSNWLHMDLAGAFNNNSTGKYAAGATAMGVRTIAKLISE